MVTADAIQVVDDTLRRLVEHGLDDVGLSPRPTVTVGPLDREAEGPRLNWFLYRIAPNVAFRNMEPPRTGSRSARARRRSRWNCTTCSPPSPPSRPPPASRSRSRTSP